MKISLNTGVPTPQAFIAINKSRMKQYNKSTKTPTYYLQKGQEFQLELFNPTTTSILAKIFLNANPISQGGLVLRPGERIFLDRYIDVAKKFLFDTYDVANTSEVKKAIEDNGDFKVEFYKEYIPKATYYGNLTLSDTLTWVNSGINNNVIGSESLGFYDSNFNQINASNNYNTQLYSTTSLNSFEGPNIRSKKSLNKSIETGRVEQGSESNQKLKTVNMSWEISPFHTLEYKLLPLSQKTIGSEDLKVKVYCTNCGTKLGKGHKFCSGCGKKA